MHVGSGHPPASPKQEKRADRSDQRKNEGYRNQPAVARQVEDCGYESYGYEANHRAKGHENGTDEHEGNGWNSH
jgi:hypothetical protein